MNEEQAELKEASGSLQTQPRSKRRHRALAKLRELIEKAKHDPLARPKTSELLASIAEGPENDKIPMGELVAALDRRAFGALLLLGGFLSLIPLPPGVGTLVAIPIFLFGFQLVLGKHKPWLPVFIRRRTFRRGDIAKYLFVKNGWIRYAESFFRPRLLALTWLLSPYIVGAVVMVVALYLALPIPLFGIIPALMLMLIAAALIENDGLLLAIGIAGALAAIVVSVYFTAGTIALTLATVGRLLGL